MLYLHVFDVVSVIKYVLNVYGIPPRAGIDSFPKNENLLSRI